MWLNECAFHVFFFWGGECEGNSISSSYLYWNETVMETTTICIPRNAFIVLARTQVAFLTLSSADVSRNIHLLVVYLSFLHSIFPHSIFKNLRYFTITILYYTLLYDSHNNSLTHSVNWLIKSIDSHRNNTTNPTKFFPERCRTHASYLILSSFRNSVSYIHTLELFNS